MGVNYQTTYACKKKIDTVRLDIYRLKNQIMEKEKIITQLEERIKEIEAYHDNHPIEERTLKKYIAKDTKTVELLDEFEKTTDTGIKKYDRILDSGAWPYKKFRRYQFIIERVEGRKCIGDITMTNYKTGKGNQALIKYAKEQIQEYLENNDVDVPVEILFEKPYLIRGQKSANRRGYGSEYNGRELIKQGTLYGETTDYAIVGVKYIEWKS